MTLRKRSGQPANLDITEPSGRSPAAACPTIGCRLIMVHGPTPGRVYVIEGPTVLGRGWEADFPIDATSVSRSHARISANKAGELVLEDLGSRNGTRVNDEAVSSRPRPLCLGDRIELGTGVQMILSPLDPAEEKSRQAQKMHLLGQMAGGMAHDVNNLIGAALANIQYVLSAGDVERAKREDCLRDAETALKRMMEIVARLLAFGRRRTHGREWVQLAPLLQETLALVRHHAPPGVKLHCEAPDGIAVCGDSTRLLQVFLNLGVNAVQAMPGGGRVTVVVDRTRDESGAERVRVRVSDTGDGMDDNVKRHLFEPFFTTRGVGRGTGLGLATVLSVVQDHQGSVEVDSAPGRGTTFTILLPAVVDDGKRTTDPAVTP